MNYNEENSELFDLYLNGKLRERELTEFEKRISDDKVFAESFNIHSLIVSGIREHSKLELKHYLKEHGTVNSNTWKLKSYKIYYALAAVLVLFIGVYFIMHFYVHSDTSSEIAINNTQQKAITHDSLQANQTETENSAEAISPVVSQKDHLVLQNETTKESLISPPDESSAEMETSPASTVEDMSEGIEYNDKVVASKKQSDIHIAEEKKLKDTTIQLIVLYAVFEENSSDNQEIISNKNISMRTAVIKKEKKNRKITAENSKKNAGSVDDSKVNTEQDTLLTKAKEKSSVDIEPSTQSMHVEFWQSPLKFRGYKYTGNTIHFYGLTDPAFKLYVVNSNIYLKTGGLVYSLIPCSKGCPFKTETNTNISDFIMKQD